MNEQVSEHEREQEASNIYPNEIEMGFKYRIMYFIHVGLYIYEKIHLYMEQPNQTEPYRTKKPEQEDEHRK